jgi:hypothetical protein
MGIGENSNKKASSPKIDKGKSWRKKMIIDVLGDDFLENNLLDENNDQQTDDAFVDRLLEEEINEPEELKEEADGDLIEHDDLEKKLEAYYADQKESDLKAFEYCRENYGNEQVWEWLRYRWEFMRRSPEYIAAFEQGQDIDEKEKVSFNLFKRFEFWKSFGLLCSELPDPKLSFEELQDSKKYDLSQEPFFRLNFITKNFRTDAGISYFTYLDDDIDIGEFNKVQFIIDFTKLKSIKDSKMIISRLIDDLWNDYYKRTGRKIKSGSMDAYERILTVGDLKDKDGMSYLQIAEKIFKNAKSDKSAERKVSAYYKRYEELINGGYRTI